jgi:hypothetical protein
MSNDDDDEIRGTADFPTLSAQVAQALLDDPPPPNPALMRLLSTERSGRQPDPPNYQSMPDPGQSPFDRAFVEVRRATENIALGLAGVGRATYAQRINEMARRVDPRLNEFRMTLPGGVIQSVQMERVVAQARYDYHHVEHTMVSLGNPFNGSMGQEIFNRIQVATGGNRELLQLMPAILNQFQGAQGSTARDQMVLATCIMLLVEDDAWHDSGMNNVTGYEFQVDRDIRTMEHHLVMHGRRAVDTAQQLMNASGPARNAASTYTESLRPSRPTEKKAPELPKAPTGRRLRLGKAVSNVEPGDVSVPTQPSSDGRESTRKVNLRKRRT